MANAYATLTESTGPKVQTDANSISASTVEAQVCVVVSATGSGSFVGINESTGKKFRTFLNNGVHSLAVVPCDSTGAPL